MNELMGSLGVIWIIFLVFMGILLFLTPLFVMLINSKMEEVVRQLRRMNKNQVLAYKQLVSVNPQYDIPENPDYEILK